MTDSNNEKVQQFLSEIMMIDPEKHRSLMEMRDFVFTIYPRAEERMMYGGILFSEEVEDFCGLFVRKHHISLEFSQGVQMNDPNRFLEGTGKFRRHLKIRAYEEIKGKEVVSFVKQAYNSH